MTLVMHNNTNKNENKKKTVYLLFKTMINLNKILKYWESYF